MILRKINILLALWVILLGCESKHNHETSQNKMKYTCPMHPQIIQDKPGTCPICSMDLVPISNTEGESGKIVLHDEQIKLANIQVRSLNSGKLNNQTILTGTLAIDAQQTEVISSRTSGRIERLYLKETGERIQKGQPLYEIYSEQLLTLQNEYLLAIDQNSQLGKEDSKYSTFLESTKKKLLLFGLTENQIESLKKAGKPSSRITYLSPTSGIVTNIMASEGMYVSEGTALYQTEKLDKLWVEAELYPQEASQIKVGQKVKVQIPGYENKEIIGTVSFLNPELDQNSLVLRLRIEILNPGNQFIPGMQANIVLEASKEEGILLPIDAVIRDEKGSHVWVRTAKNTFSAKMVKLGSENSNQIEILEGLDLNDQVVISGAYLLYSEFVLKKGGDLMAGHKH